MWICELLLSNNFKGKTSLFKLIFWNIQVGNKLWNRRILFLFLCMSWVICKIDRRRERASIKFFFSFFFSFSVCLKTWKDLWRVDEESVRRGGFKTLSICFRVFSRYRGCHSQTFLDGEKTEIFCQDLYMKLKAFTSYKKSQ